MIDLHPPLSVRRRLARLRARLRGEPAIVVHGQAYQVEFPGVPIDALRSERILTALVREGLIGREAVLPPPRATLASLERIHSRAYLERVTEPELIQQVFGVELPAKLIHRVVELQRTMVGGTMSATRAARHQHKLAVNLGGGLHHAQRERGQGFCLFNDIAVAIAEQRERGFREPIAVIDLDLHDGDGTRSIFADDPSVFTLSIHNAHWGPTAAVASLAVALGDQVGDREYLASIREHVPAMLDRHRPGLVFYLAGCDVAADDSLGNWRITDEGMLARDLFVLEALRERGIAKRVWVLGGGYGSEAWRHGARGLIAALGGPERVDLPSTQSITLMRYRHLASVLDPRELSGVEPGELQFDESDLFGAAPDHGPPDKVLGFYTHHGVELAFERYGLLPRLRALGFEPRLEFDHDREAGDTLRVFGDEGTQLLLIELRLRRDREILPGAELLRIEWLLLQNPRASWTAGRLPLPGQRHPGLRMFDDIAAMMMMVCERLRLDGIVVVPSHYHVAARWHGRMRFLDPVAEGRFRALAELFRDMPLAETCLAVELGRVVDRQTGERIGYRPAAMISPASDAMNRRFDEAWEREAEATRRWLQLELVSGPDTPQPA
jgi:acetoin utilization deacetylase AcuC-like enzyme